MNVHSNGAVTNGNGHVGLSAILPDEAELVAFIRKHGPLSRTDLAKLAGYSRAKITPLVSHLVELGVLAEVGDGESQGGRRPRMLNINTRHGYVVGIDIGATSIDVALADLSGHLLDRTGEPSDVRAGPETVLEQARYLIAQLLQRRELAPEQVYAIGVGVPGPVQFAAGVLIAPPLMPTWHAFPIQETLRTAFPMARVVVDNDVNVMALGELRAGAGVGIENLIFIKIGTGIGAGIICHGAVYRGSNGSAGDVGHICANPNGPVCTCGNTGCLEVLAAGPAIAARAETAAQSGKSLLLAAQFARNGVLTPEDVGAVAAAGDRAATEIVQESGRWIGEVLAGLVNFYNPSLILIGGGVSNIGYQLLASIRQAVLQRSLPLATKDLRIDYASLGMQAGTTGAIALALEHVFIVDTT